MALVVTYRLMRTRKEAPLLHVLALNSVHSNAYLCSEMDFDIPNSKTSFKGLILEHLSIWSKKTSIKRRQIKLWRHIARLTSNNYLVTTDVK